MSHCHFDQDGVVQPSVKWLSVESCHGPGSRLESCGVGAHRCTCGWGLELGACTESCHSSSAVLKRKVTSIRRGDRAFASKSARCTICSAAVAVYIQWAVNAVWLAQKACLALRHQRDVRFRQYIKKELQKKCVRKYRTFYISRSQEERRAAWATEMIGRLAHGKHHNMTVTWLHTMSNVISSRKKSLQFSMKMAISIKIPFSLRDRKINMFIKTASFPMKNALQNVKGPNLACRWGPNLACQGCQARLSSFSGQKAPNSTGHPV